MALVPFHGAASAPNLRLDRPGFRRGVVALGPAAVLNSVTYTAGSGGTPANFALDYTYAGTGTLTAVIRLLDSGSAVVGTLTADPSGGDVTLTGIDPAAEGAVSFSAFIRAVGGPDSNIVTGAVSGIDLTGVQVASFNPLNSATDVPVSGDLVVTLTENSFPGTGSVTIGGQTIAVGSTTVSGTTWTIPYTGLTASTSVDVTWPEGIVKDASGNPIAALEVGTLSFTTAAGGATFPTLGANLIARWTPGDPTTIYQDTARTTLADTDGDPVLAWEDISGNGQHISNSNSLSTYDATAGATDFSVVDGMSTPLNTAGTDTSFDLYFTISTTFTPWAMISVSGSIFAGIIQDGSTAGTSQNLGGAITYEVDDVVLTGATRDDLHTAICDGLPHVVAIKNITSATEQRFWILGYVGNGFDLAGGLVSQCLLIENATPEADKDDLYAFLAANLPGA